MIFIAKGEGPRGHETISVRRVWMTGLRNPTKIPASTSAQTSYTPENARQASSMIQMASGARGCGDRPGEVCSDDGLATGWESDRLSLKGR